MRTDDRIKATLGGLGYPGFRYLRLLPRKSIRGKCFSKLSGPTIWSRESSMHLPWVLAYRNDLDLRAVTDQFRSAGLQNRLGFLIEITVSAAKRLRCTEMTE
jgi:hypothetical protein